MCSGLFASPSKLTVSQKVESLSSAGYEHMLLIDQRWVKICFGQQNVIADCSLTNEK